MTHTPMTMEERLEKLENDVRQANRRNRYLRYYLVPVGLVATYVAYSGLSVWTAGSIRSREVHARLFVLEDEKGQGRAGLGVNKDGPSLTLFDEKGHGRAGLEVKDGVAELALADDKQNRAVLRVEKDGVAELVLSDEKGTTRVALGASHTTTPDGKTSTSLESSLRLFDPNGTIRWSAP